MRISVFGLGYVGGVTAACLARDGHHVLGVDINPLKVAAVRAGRAAVAEPGLSDLVAAASAAGRLDATTDHLRAVRESELSLVCVGTPGADNGRPDLRHLERCCRAIGEGLRKAPAGHVVAVRSTVLPGTMGGVVLPLLEATSGRRAGRAFALAHHPEFMREGNAIEDFDAPAKVVIGTRHALAADRLEALYRPLGAPVVRTDPETAELVKFVDNGWHALKVGFANEAGRLARAFKVDGRAVMDVLCLDGRLNLSSAYLAPGFAFGGSCLPKDLRALGHAARDLDLELPILDAVLPSNQRHLEQILARVLASGASRVGVLGLSFKEGTDDLRESPLVALIERLLGKGRDVRVFDPVVHPEAMLGANREYALRHLPHIARLMAPSAAAVVEHGELVLIGHVDPAYVGEVRARAAGRRILDCVGIEALRGLEGYEGACW